MGRIVATVDVQNVAEPRLSKKLDALVDTGASYLTLPRAWKEQFGSFEAEEVIELQTATQEPIKGTVCGPVRVQVEGFRAIYNEVLFIDMEPEDGGFEPLLGYIALEQCGAAVDLVGHRLLPVRYMDAKGLRSARPGGVSKAVPSALEEHLHTQGHARITVVSTRTAHRFHRASGRVETAAPHVESGLEGAPMTKLFPPPART